MITGVLITRAPITGVLITRAPITGVLITRAPITGVLITRAPITGVLIARVLITCIRRPGRDPAPGRRADAARRARRFALHPENLSNAANCPAMGGISL